jgi:DNA-binding response OmpR family regulator
MKKRILVVEDNAKLLASMVALLEDHFDILEAEDGREGIDKARLQNPDLIISDIMMPVASGYDLVEELKQNDRTKHIPIILLTALGDDEKRIEGYNHGADDYIVKPFKFDVLLSRVNNLLKSRQSLREIYDKAAPINHQFGVKDPMLSHMEALLVNHFKFRNFSIPEIAELMNMTPSKLERDIKKLTGMTPIKYLNDFRLNKAKHMLETGDKSIFEVSYALGFKSMSYFGKAYKEKFGIAPSKTNNL